MALQNKEEGIYVKVVVIHADYPLKLKSEIYF